MLRLVIDFDGFSLARGAELVVHPKDDMADDGG